jgi:hypothetical protein
MYVGFLDEYIDPLGSADYTKTLFLVSLSIWHYAMYNYVLEYFSFFASTGQYGCLDILEH